MERVISSGRFMRRLDRFRMMFSVVYSRIRIRINDTWCWACLVIPRHGRMIQFKHRRQKEDHNYILGIINKQIRSTHRPNNNSSPNRMMHIHPSTVMPRRQQRSTLPTVVVDILQRRHQIGDTPETEAAAQHRRPSMRGIPRMRLHACHLPLSADRTIHGRRPPLQRMQRCRAVVPAWMAHSRRGGVVSRRGGLREWLRLGVVFGEGCRGLHVCVLGDWDDRRGLWLVGCWAGVLIVGGHRG